MDPRAPDDTAPSGDDAARRHAERARLRAAAQQLTSPIRAERDAGESILVAARDAAVPALVALLEDTIRRPPQALSHSPIARAALLLGAIGDRRAITVLCRVVKNGALGGDDGAFVARALAELTDGRDAFDDVVRATLEALSTSPDMYTRAYAAEAFGALGDARSKARVVALSEDKAPWVRERAAAVLQRLAEASAKATAASTSIIDFAALVDDAEHAGGVLRPLLDDLRDERRAVRDAAVAELVKVGKAAVPALIHQINQPNVRARIGAATALGRLQPPEAAGPLLIAAAAPASTADEKELRPIALRALANCLTGTEEGLSASLLPLSRDADRFTRAAALLCLGRLADRRGMRAVVAAVLESEPFVVESAAVALSEGVREDDVELVRPLLVALAKRPAPKAAVKEAILIALSRIAIEDPAMRVRARHRVRKDIGASTASSRKAAIVLLERMYDDADPPPLSVIDDVADRLADDNPEVRVVAAAFLVRHLPPGMTGMAERLAIAIRRRERTLSLLCLDALHRHHTLEARAIVTAAGRDPDDVVKRRAMELTQEPLPAEREWAFAPRPTIAPTAAPPSLTPRATTTRPSRVSAADDTGEDVVAAKDG